MDQPQTWRDYPVRDEPSVSAQDVLDALYQIKAGHDRLDQAERALIDMARHRGVTWLEISRALGVGTAQAAQQRRKRLGDPPGADDRPDPSPQVLMHHAKPAELPSGIGVNAVVTLGQWRSPFREGFAGNGRAGAAV